MCENFDIFLNFMLVWVWLHMQEWVRNSLFHLSFISSSFHSYFFSFTSFLNGDDLSVMRVSVAILFQSLLGSSFCETRVSSLSLYLT